MKMLAPAEPPMQRSITSQKQAALCIRERDSARGPDSRICRASFPASYARNTCRKAAWRLSPLTDARSPSLRAAGTKEASAGGQHEPPQPPPASSSAGASAGVEGGNTRSAASALAGPTCPPALLLLASAATQLARALLPLALLPLLLPARRPAALSAPLWAVSAAVAAPASPARTAAAQPPPAPSGPSEAADEAPPDGQTAAPASPAPAPAALPSAASAASTPPLSQQAGWLPWLAQVQQEALLRGLPPAVVAACLDDLEPFEEVVARDSSKAETSLTAEEYVRRLVSPSRRQQGLAALRRHLPLLQRLHAKYGVPPHVLVAVWGVESSYGANTGSYDAVQALATLAFRSPERPRASLFREELFCAMQLLADDAGPVLGAAAASSGGGGAAEQLPPSRALDGPVLCGSPPPPAPRGAPPSPGQLRRRRAALLGSYAGALGQCQFLPSSFLAYAVDEDGDGRRDIWHSPADVLASMAHFLQQHGWRAGEAVCCKVRLPPAFALDQLPASRPLSAWLAAPAPAPASSSAPCRPQLLGAAAAELPGELAARVVAPDGAEGLAVLAFRNFDVLLRYNRYPLYAMAVAELAEQIRSGAAAESPALPSVAHSHSAAQPRQQPQP